MPVTDDPRTMTQNTDPPKWVRIRSAMDPKWIAMLAIGLVVSLTYYGAILWAVVWLGRTVMAWWAPA